MPKSKSAGILVLAHRIYKDDILKRGGVDYIIDYLRSRGCKYFLVENPLREKGRTIIKMDGDEIRSFGLYGKGLVRWIQEIFLNTIYILISNIRFRFIIAVDPLNFLSAYIIKAFRPTRILFHSVDYSENRFDNAFMNFWYNYFYKLAVSKADIVTYVSPMMGRKINEFCNKFEGRILFYLPNSPEYSKVPKADPVLKSKYDVVYTKSFLGDNEVDILIETLKLCVKTLPELKVHLIGNVSEAGREKIENSDISRHFELYGQVDYAKNIEIISKAYIGIAWYENLISFERYADSLKIREYAASGLPSVCNNKISTALEMQKENAGLIANTPSELSEKLVYLITDPSEYGKISRCALKWAEKNDKTVLMEKLYKIISPYLN